MNQISHYKIFWNKLAVKVFNHSNKIFFHVIANRKEVDAIGVCTVHVAAYKAMTLTEIKPVDELKNVHLKLRNLHMIAK